MTKSEQVLELVRRIMEEENGSNLSLITFFVLTALGLVSRPVFYAVSLSTDILPIEHDLKGLLGITEEHPEISPPQAVAGLILLGLFFYLAFLSPDFRYALLAAGDIVPFPHDFKKVLATGPTSPTPIPVNACPALWNVVPAGLPLHTGPGATYPVQYTISYGQVVQYQGGSNYIDSDGHRWFKVACWVHEKKAWVQGFAPAQSLTTGEIFLPKLGALTQDGQMVELNLSRPTPCYSAAGQLIRLQPEGPIYSCTPVLVPYLTVPSQSLQPLKAGRMAVGPGFVFPGEAGNWNWLGGHEPPGTKGALCYYDLALQGPTSGYPFHPVTTHPVTTLWSVE